MQQKLEEVRQPPPRVRPVPSLVPRPPQTSLVKFVGNIYTLKCRYEAPGGGREATCLELVCLEPLNSAGAAWGLDRKPQRCPRAVWVPAKGSSQKEVPQSLGLDPEFCKVSQTLTLSSLVTLGKDFLFHASKFLAIQWD